MRTPFILALLTIVQLSLGQAIRTLKPVVGRNRDYTQQEQVVWQKEMDRYNSPTVPFEKLSEFDKKMLDSLEALHGPMTESNACSWYCGGGPYKVISSSYLKKQGKTTYPSDNIHDFNLFTAWVPDTEAGIIGQKVNFYFKPFSPRVNEIIIYNGYIKNIELWRANSRAKKLKLYINEKPHVYLDLLDVSGSQTFKIDLIQSTDKANDLILTFEVIEVYNGAKYEDLAISEINFNGEDVHCFAAGTRILMADTLEKNIELIKQGDLILTYNQKTDKLEEAHVSRLVIANHSNVVKLIFEDREIIVTDDHSFFIDGNRWASINPHKSNGLYVQDRLVTQLSIGDQVFIPEFDKFVQLIKIDRLNDEQLTYTIELSSESNFIANGLLVKTEMVSPKIIELVEIPHYKVR